MAQQELFPAHNLIPGAYERNTLTHRQSGSMSGPGFGSANLQIGDSTLSPATVLDRELEGGGGISQRPRRVTASPSTVRFNGGYPWVSQWWRLALSWFRRPALNS